MFFWHSYVVIVLLSHLGTTFVAKSLHKTTNLSELNSQHDSSKRPQAVGVVKRSPFALKRRELDHMVQIG